MRELAYDNAGYVPASASPQVAQSTQVKAATQGIANVRNGAVMRELAYDRAGYVPASASPQVAQSTQVKAATQGIESVDSQIQDALAKIQDLNKQTDAVITAQNTPVVLGGTTPVASMAGQPYQGADGYWYYPMSDGTTVKGALGQTQTNQGDLGATQILADTLNAAGLGSLASNVWSMYQKGANINQIMDDPVNGIRASAVYKARFPAMALLNAEGRGITEGDYLAKEATDAQILQDYGLPASVYGTPDVLGKLIANNVSSVEFQDRLKAWAQDFSANADPAIAQYMKDHMGLTSGDLLAGWIDPTKALPDIQARSQAGVLGGVAANSGFNLDSAQALRLAQQGVSASEAKNVFGQIGQSQQLTQQLPGDAPAALTQQQLLDAAFGTSSDAIMQLNRVRQARTAEFQGGGQFATDQHGVTGLGVAGTR